MDLGRPPHFDLGSAGLAEVLDTTFSVDRQEAEIPVVPAVRLQVLLLACKGYRAAGGGRRGRAIATGGRNLVWAGSRRGLGRAHTPVNPP